MLVKDVMTSRAETIGPDETLRAAACRMKERGVGALVVCENGRAIGVLTDRDIVVRAVALGRDLADADVLGAMTPQVISCCEDDELEHAVSRMESGAVRRAIILDAGGGLAGMLSADDVALRSPDLAGGIIAHALAPERPVRRGPWPWWEEPTR